MQVTYENPCGYKVEKKPATLYNLLYILVVLVGAFAIFHDTNASDNNWCDAMYSEYFFQEVPQPIQVECKNRFIYRTNQIKSKFRNY